jgi:hypothetical protein
LARGVKAKICKTRGGYNVFVPPTSVVFKSVLLAVLKKLTVFPTAPTNIIKNLKIHEFTKAKSLHGEP